MLTTLSNDAHRKFPMVACDNISKHFTGKDGIKNWESTAVKEYKKNIDLKRQGMREHFSGVMECFCK
jgi:hypothetical protein